jgi:hypothetical protein
MSGTAVSIDPLVFVARSGIRLSAGTLKGPYRTERDSSGDASLDPV